jgi:hypothetical protein
VQLVRDVPGKRHPARGLRWRSAVCAALPGRAPFAGSCPKWRVPRPGVRRLATFGFILLPGALLGRSVHHSRRLLALAPLLFLAVLLSDPFDDGFVWAAVGVPVLDVLGAFALRGDGGPPPG